MKIPEAIMKNRIDDFINDFYYDMDNRTESKSFAMKYIDEEIEMSVLGDPFSKADGFISWYDGLKAGFETSYHQIKQVDIKEETEFINVTLALSWIASFRNMGDKNKIKHNLLANLHIVENSNGFIITKYRCKVA